MNLRVTSILLPILCFYLAGNAFGASMCVGDNIPKTDGLYVYSPDNPRQLERFPLRLNGDVFRTIRRVPYHRDKKILLVGSNHNFVGLKDISNQDDAILVKSYSQGGKKRELSYISLFRSKIRTKCSNGMYLQSASGKYNLLPVSEYLAHHSGVKSDRFLREKFHFKIYSDGDKCVSTDKEIDEISKPVAQFFNVKGLTQIAALPNLYRNSTAIASANATIEKNLSSKFSGVSASLIYSAKGSNGCVELFAPIPTWEPTRGWRLFSTTGQLAYREAENWKPESTNLVIGGVRNRNATTIQIRWQ